MDLHGLQKFRAFAPAAAPRDFALLVQRHADSDFGQKFRAFASSAFRPRYYTLYLPYLGRVAPRPCAVSKGGLTTEPPHNISSRSQNARSMAHSLLGLTLSVVQRCGGRSRQIKLSGRSALTVACNRLFFAHLTPLKLFAMLTSFRAFAPKNRRISLIRQRRFKIWYCLG